MEGVSMGAQMSIAASSMFPGFRFCPTDEELISYYLRKKLDGHEESVQVISEVELCKFEPWDLPGKSFIQSENEWFFFSPRGRKYPNGSQSKRATESGYWKATGKERNVKSGGNVIGTKRTLVFHLGRAPKGERTEWIMHEYCINDKSQDALVVCRLKRNTDFRVNDNHNRASSSQMNHHHVNSHESDCDHQRGLVCQQDHKDRGGCSSKRSCSSISSPSTEPIDSVTESNQRPHNEATLTESSGHPKVDEEDCYAEILKDDIIKLDESSLSQKAHTTTPPPTQQDHHPCQGTAQRRIRLRVGNSRPPPSSSEGRRIRFPISKQSSKNTTTTLFARITNRSVALFGLLVFTLAAIFLLFIGWSQSTQTLWGFLGGVKL